jgi:hypothetical protein
MMSDYYGIELHDKVNAATSQAIAPKITKTNGLGIALQACLIFLSCPPQSDPRSRIFHAIASDSIKTLLRYDWAQDALGAVVCNSLNSVQGRVLDAYRRAIHDDGSPPTIGEVRWQFLEENKKTLLPKAYSLRKMLTQTYNLPLSPGKRGRPK